MLPAARSIPRVCLIAAPAGYGKTVLLHQMTARLGMPGRIASARGWGDDGDVDDAVRSLPRPAYLAVDDLHELEGSRTEAEVLQLVERGPDDLKLVLATRAAPAANLSRLRANGELWDVAADDLRFRSWEVDQVFRDVWRDRLTSSEVATLTRRTGGWAACLQLFHLATSGRGSAHRAVALSSLRGSSAVTAAYLTQNVLDGLPPDLRSFLVQTAVLRTLTPDACDELTGRAGSVRALEELERRRLLERSVDRAAWRCPRVLRTHLESVLVEDAGPEAPARWLAAATILERRRSVADAVHAYLRAGEIGGAVRLLNRHGPAVADAAGADLVEEASCGDPWLVLASARWLRAQGRADDAIAAYRRAEDASKGASASAVSAAERRALSCWLDPLEQPPRGWSGALRSSLSQRPLRPPEVDDPAHAEMARGFAALARGEVAEAERSLAAASSDGDASPPATLASRVGLAAALVLGADDRGVDVAERAAEEAEVLDLSWLVRLARAVVGASGPPGRPRPHFDDPLGRILSSLLDGIGALRRGETAPRSFDDAVTESHRLGLVALEAWARAGQA
ncbi:MAG TPA: hypothetical protein VEU29_06375, partial [Actinomycetota bacterium]|nr:hypothetical protein [Actinomycetota bacterium]